MTHLLTPLDAPLVNTNTSIVVSDDHKKKLMQLKSSSADQKLAITGKNRAFYENE